MIVDIVIGLVFFIYYYWLFSATGLVFLSFFRVKLFNFHFATLLGLFIYFFVIALFLIPIEFISTLSFIILVYILIVINILYLIFLLIFLRYWFNFHFLRKTHIYFFIITILFIFLFYLQKIFIDSTNDQNISKFLSEYFYANTGNIVETKLTNSDLLLDRLGWYANIAMWIKITHIEPKIFTYNIISLYDSIFFSSLFLTIVANFTQKKEYELFFGLFSLAVFWLTKLLIYFLGFQNYSANNFIVNLFLAIFVMFSIFINDSYRSRSLPWIFGFVLASYACFSWDASYNILFIIYILAWLILLHYKQSFIHDLTKLLTVPSVMFIIYNMWHQNIVLMLIFLALLILVLFANFLIHFRSKQNIRNETIIYVNRKKFIFFLPILFMLCSLIYLAASNKINFDFWTLKKVANLIFVQFKISEDNNAINVIFSVLTFIFLVLSIIWLLILEKIKNFKNKNNITTLAILVLTFFNPLVGKFLILCFSSQFLLYNSIVFITILLVIINSAVYSIPIDKIKKSYLKNKQKHRQEINHEV